VLSASFSSKLIADNSTIKQSILFSSLTYSWLLPVQAIKDLHLLCRSSFLFFLIRPRTILSGLYYNLTLVTPLQKILQGLILGWGKIFCRM
jgi:hypothetical protein